MAQAKRIRVVKGLGYGLDESAVETVKYWTFKPGMKDGKPVPVYATIQTNFRLLSKCKITDPPQPPPQPGANGKQLSAVRLTHNPPERPIISALLSPDGKSVTWSDASGVHMTPFSGGGDRVVESGAQTPLVEGREPGVSPDGRYRLVVSKDGKEVSLRESAGTAVVAAFDLRGDTTVRQTRWSPDSRKVAVLTGSNIETKLQSITVPDGKVTAMAPNAGELTIRSMDWSGNERLILAADETIAASKCNLWEVRGEGDASKISFWTDMPIRAGSLSVAGDRAIFVRDARQRSVYVATLDGGGKLKDARHGDCRSMPATRIRLIGAGTAKTLFLTATCATESSEDLPARSRRRPA